MKFLLTVGFGAALCWWAYHTSEVKAGVAHVANGVSYVANAVASGASTVSENIPSAAKK